MAHSKPSTIMIVDDSPSFRYLIQRYADSLGCSIAATLSSVSKETDNCSEPAAVIFASVDALEASQSLVVELANCDIPVLVCSAATDQIRARELGADYCLLHPVTYEEFQAVLTLAINREYT